MQVLDTLDEEKNMSRGQFELQAPHMSGGYYTQQRNREPTQITSPSANIRYTQDGGGRTRDGYYDTGWDLNKSGFVATPLHVSRYNITFFAVGDSVKYVDHNNSDTIVDTGLSLSGSGEDTDLKESNGDVYITNTTDGLHKIYIMRLDGSVSLGAGTINVDNDGAARLSVFSKTSGDLRINGTAEAFSSVAVGSGAPGTLTLSGTASQNYSNNTVAIVTQSLASGRPKGNKIVFFKESMNVIGVGADGADVTTGSEVPQTTLYYSDFSVATYAERIIDFANGGFEMVGKDGILTNAIATRDYMYLFKENEAYYISIYDVNTSTKGRPPQLFSAKYGCVNKHCADVMGDFVVWLTNNKRIIASNIRVEDGTAALYPDERFDSPIRELLDLMDDDQSSARVYYQTKRKELHVKVSISNQIVEVVYDNDKGIWCPPDTNKLFHGYFEIKGEPYATSDNGDTIYKLDDGGNDDGADIESCIATGIFEFKDGRTMCDWGSIAVSGSGTVNTTIEYTSTTEQGESGVKEINITEAEFGLGSPIGAVGIGSGIIGGGEEIPSEADFDVQKAVYPAKARQIQHKFYCYGDGHKMTIKSWSQKAKAYTNQLLTTT